MITTSMEHYRVQPGSRVDLAKWDADDKSVFDGSKKDGKEVLPELTVRLDKLQELLWAGQKHKVLIVLQAMDTAGKDGTIRHVFTGINPQGVRVANFKAPSAEELAHDHLWRVYKQTPASGEVVIFNRSHYEDVLVVRVHELVPTERWRRRFHQINAFELALAEEGTTILKFYLHISMDEQKARLQERLDDPEKNWKFNPGDLKERALWPQYMKAYEDVLSKTSTDWAPWYVVPANRKWYRNLLISTVLAETLEGLDMKFPDPFPGLDKIVIE